jgi:hypothetical protein
MDVLLSYCWESYDTSQMLVIVQNLNIGGATFYPAEHDTPLGINATEACSG